jgi:Rps23 Pro-64 3,4-dihydroxylase Tpa1-like proline 4-hydroxylase
MTIHADLQINPALDREAAKARYAFQRRVQILDFLTPKSATTLTTILSTKTPWGFTYQDGTSARHITSRELEGLTRGRSERIAKTLHEHVQSGTYSFGYHNFPLSRELLEAHAETGELKEIAVFLNSPSILELIRDITGKPSINVSTAMAALFTNQHFQGQRTEQITQAPRIGFSLQFTTEWQNDWGAHLQFLAPTGDIIQSYKPRYNCLVLFDLSQPHAVSFIPSFANKGHYCINGEFSKA